MLEGRLNLGRALVVGILEKGQGTSLKSLLLLLSLALVDGALLSVFILHQLSEHSRIRHLGMRTLHHITAILFGPLGVFLRLGDLTGKDLFLKSGLKALLIEGILSGSRCGRGER